MTTVQAWQHIYSNVEQEQSPKGQGGFQTLFYTTAGLTADEVSEMEGRLLYFPSKTVEPVKRIFFTTTTGKAVIAQIVVLSDPDQFGRKGRYLAHALAFALEDLAKFEADPFRVYRSFSFFTNVAEVLAQGNFETGDIGPVSVDVSAGLAQDIQAARQWPEGELKKLALLALRVDPQTQRREAITFAGEPEEIESALAAAFVAVPTVMRPRCIFDTYFYRCNLVATFYWAVGFPEPPVSIKFVMVDGQARSIQGAAPTQPETAYEHWVMDTIEGQKLDALAQERNRAFALGEWLDERAYDADLLEAVPPQLITAVFKVNPPKVQAMLRHHISKHIPEALVDRAADHIYQQTEPIDIYQQLRHGFTIPQLLDVLYNSFETQGFSDPGREQVKALRQLLEDSDHGLLNLFVALWRSARRYLPSALEAANEADYRHFGEIVTRLQLGKPLQLLIPGRGEIFLDFYLASGVDDWVDLVATMIETKETACLSRLSSQVTALSRKELWGLDRLAKEQPDTPQDFIKAIEQAIAALPPEGGLKGFLKSAWGRLPGLGED